MTVVPQIPAAFFEVPDHLNGHFGICLLDQDIMMIGERECPFGPFTVTISRARVTSTPDGMTTGFFPILLIM
jgi:hypothetical protein